jgi:hypothetical protein
MNYLFKTASLLLPPLGLILGAIKMLSGDVVVGESYLGYALLGVALYVYLIL